MYERILAAVVEYPWAILPSVGAAIAAVLRERAGGRRPGPEEIEARIAEAVAVDGLRARGGAGPTAPGVAVIPIHGIMAQRGGVDQASRSLTSTDALRAMVRAAVASADVGGILLDVDSPGGSVFGIQELAEEIRDARAVKPVVAIANSVAASAAYWIASQAEEVVVTPSGQVGSIGVYAMHENFAKHAELAGVEVSFVSAGKFKVEGNEFEALGEEARGAIQDKVNTYYEAFVADVAKGRKASRQRVRGGYGEGRMVLAEPALAEGMVDRIGTLEAELAGLAKRVSKGSARAETGGRTEAEDLEFRRRRARLV